MLLKQYFVSILQTVIVVCLINALFLYFYLNYDFYPPYIVTEEELIIRPSSAKCLQEFLANNFNKNATLSPSPSPSSSPLSSHSPSAIRSYPPSENSRLSINNKQLQIIYYKTHKTASTTVGSIIFRLGAQHGVRFLPYREHYYDFKNPPPYEVDIALNHHTPGSLHYQDMMLHYKQLVPCGKFLTILREPTRRSLSAYHYYTEPNKRSLKYFFTENFHVNAMSHDLGIKSDSDMRGFMETAYKHFSFLIMEKFDETLLLLKNAWGWTLQDILYLKLNDACKVGANFDGMPMSCRPRYDELTEEELKNFKKMNTLDTILYERALNDTNTLLALQPPSFWEELGVFREMLNELLTFCTSKTNETTKTAKSKYKPICESYYIEDKAYEEKILKGNGWVDYSKFSVSFQ